MDEIIKKIIKMQSGGVEHSLSDYSRETGLFGENLKEALWMAAMAQMCNLIEKWRV